MALGAARSGCRTGFLGPLVKLFDRHGSNVLRSLGVHVRYPEFGQRIN